MSILELTGEVVGWLVVAAVWCGLSLFFFVVVLYTLFGEGDLRVNEYQYAWRGLFWQGREAPVVKSHCDQCGEYIDRREGGWFHTGTGNKHCVLTMTNGVADGWSAEECEPCGIEGCQGNEEWEETHP